jgi:plastocyanin
MIWRLVIYFEILAASAHAGDISGTVILRDSKLASVASHKDYSDVVISLHPLDASPPELAAGRHAQMLQKNKTFTPHVLPIETGTVVNFPNADPIFHNAFSSFSGQIFDVGLYPPGTDRPVRFSRPGAVRVFCNIHPSMSAIILVLNTPYFTKTARSGTFQLTVPEGNYELRVFHERATQERLDTLTQRIVVREQAVRLPEIAVSEAGYVPGPHKNKYGHDYPPDAGSETYIPGARN